MKLIKELTLRFLPSAVISLAVLWWFQPALFKAGINRVEWVTIIKVLFSVIALWWFIYSIIRAVNNQNKIDLIRGKSETIKLNQEQEKVLMSLSNHNWKSISEIAQNVNIIYSAVELYLKDMENISFVQNSLNSSYTYVWTIDTEGTRYLLNKGLIKSSPT
jgi:hypothetical protein